VVVFCSLPERLALTLLAAERIAAPLHTRRTVLESWPTGSREESCTSSVRRGMRSVRVYVGAFFSPGKARAPQLGSPEGLALL